METSNKGKHPDLEILFTVVCFLHVYKAFTFLGVEEASLHHLTVKFQSLYLLFFECL